MTSKKQGSDSGGDLFSGIIDLLSILIMKAIDLFIMLINFLLNKYVFNRNQEVEVKKISREDLKVKRTTLSESALGYSVTRKRNIMMEELDRRKHTMVVGASGYGKSVALDALMFDDMRKGKPVIFIDPKGDNASLEQFINMCRMNGREYFIFSEHYEGAGKCALNPCKDGSVTQIADRIYHAFTWSEEHYAQICYDALADAIELLLTHKMEVTFEAIHAKLLAMSMPKVKKSKGTKTQEVTSAEAPKVEPDPNAYSRENIQGIISRISKLRRSDFGPCLVGPDAFSFQEMRATKKCVYIGLPVLGMPEMARALGKMILGDVAYSAYQAFTTIKAGQVHKFGSLGLYIDELSAVITEEFIEIQNKCRGAGIEMTFAFQCPADIQKISPQLCNQVLESASNWFILKQRTEEAANIFAKAIGTIESKKQTVRVEDGVEQNQGSQRVVEESIVHANVIKSLRTGQCVLLRQGPVKVDLVNLKYIDPKIVISNVNFLEGLGKIPKQSAPAMAANRPRKNRFNHPYPGTSEIKRKPRATLSEEVTS